MSVFKLFVAEFQWNSWINSGSQMMVLRFLHLPWYREKENAVFCSCAYCECISMTLIMNVAHMCPRGDARHDCRNVFYSAVPFINNSLLKYTYFSLQTLPQQKVLFFLLNFLGPDRRTPCTPPCDKERFFGFSCAIWLSWHLQVQLHPNTTRNWNAFLVFLISSSVSAQDRISKFFTPVRKTD